MPSLRFSVRAARAFQGFHLWPRTLSPPLSSRLSSPSAAAPCTLRTGGPLSQLSSHLPLGRLRMAWAPSYLLFLPSRPLLPSACSLPAPRDSARSPLHSDVITLCSWLPNAHSSIWCGASTYPEAPLPNPSLPHHPITQAGPSRLPQNHTQSSSSELQSKDVHCQLQISQRPSGFSSG